MTISVTMSWRNDNPDTIFNRLAARIGREPTHAEVKTELDRILTNATIDAASRGDLWFQKGRAT